MVVVKKRKPKAAINKKVNIEEEARVSSTLAAADVIELPSTQAPDASSVTPVLSGTPPSPSDVLEYSKMEALKYKSDVHEFTGDDTIPKAEHVATIDQTVENEHVFEHHVNPHAPIQKCMLVGTTDLYTPFETQCIRASPWSQYVHEKHMHGKKGYHHHRSKQ